MMFLPQYEFCLRVDLLRKSMQVKRMNGLPPSTSKRFGIEDGNVLHDYRCHIKPWLYPLSGKRLSKTGGYITHKLRMVHSTCLRNGAV